MNDSIKYMLVGAAIAVGSATLSGVVIGWSVSQAASAPRKSIQSSGSPVNQPAAPMTRLMLPAQTAASILPPGQLTSPLSRPTISNMVFRPTPIAKKTPITFNQFQKLQELPDVKAAHDAFVEAQKKYSEAMKKAVESDQGAVVSAKSAPLTIQVPPVGAANEMRRVK